MYCDDYNFLARCGLCGKEMPEDWHYAWCKQCGETGKCHHGNDPAECNNCMIESDMTFDSSREGR